MQSRVALRRLPILVSLLACLALLPTPPAAAQTSPAGGGVIRPSLQEETPQLLLITRRDPKASPHDDATRAALQDTVLSLMRGAGHYQVTVYSPTQAVVKRVLLDHVISSIDLNEPVQTEGMRHLALALGIRTMLFLTPTFDKTGMKMEAQLHQNVGRDAWQTGVIDSVSTEFQYKKRRLNPREIVALSVDGLAARLNLPSHLAADLNLETLSAGMTAADKEPKKNSKAHVDPATKATKAFEPDAPDTSDKKMTSPVRTVPDPTVPVFVRPNVVKEPRTKEPKSRAVKADRSTVRTQRNTDLTGRPNTEAATGADPYGSGSGRADVPTVQATAHTNYETLSDHYHDNHDLANTITLLRYAVNERPRDITLRRKLILAYQERKMPEAALAEITRALQIAPTEGALYRAYGATLMTNGDVPGAEKAFRDAVRLNADDIQARIALGDALMSDNQYADALDTYAVAQKTDPRSPLPHRRLARALMLGASADPARYAASLAEVGKAKELTPKNDTTGYQEDYGTLMQIAESRLREMLEEISGNFIAFNKGKQSGNDTLRALSDIQVRTDSINGYLDKLPPAVGQDLTHGGYQQAGTFLLLSITLLRSYLSTDKHDPNVKQQMQDASAEAYQELTAAHKRLIEIRAALLPR